ncbi:bola protein [Phyllosticta capitalensis]
MSTPSDVEASQNQMSSGVTPEHLKGALEQRLGAVHVDIIDMSGGCGQMFEAIIVSPQFAKKTTLARHRLVNAALKDEIAAIHAWTPKCHTPEEWEKKQSQA